MFKNIFFSRKVNPAVSISRSLPIALRYLILCNSETVGVIWATHPAQAKEAMQKERATAYETRRGRWLESLVALGHSEVNEKDDYQAFLKVCHFSVEVDVERSAPPERLVIAA